MNVRAFGFFTLSLVAVGLAGCGGGGTNPTPTAPFALPNIQGTTTTPFPFNVTGVYVGTSGFLPVQVQNTGSQPLVVSSVTYTPDSSSDTAIFISPGIALSSTPDVLVTPPFNVPYSVSMVLGLECTPPTETTYGGTVEIKSNASNLPDLVIVLTCVGVKPPA
jgi:hypothetical protein